MDMRFGILAAALLLSLGLAADDFPLAPADRVPAAEAQRDPDIASNGSELMVVWRDDRGSPAETEVYAARLRADGTPIDDRGIRLTDGPASPPHVAADGNAFVVAYTASGGRSYFTRIEDGRVTAKVLLPVRRSQTVRDLETNGRTFCVLAGTDAVFTDGFGRIEAIVDLPYGARRLVAAGDSYWAATEDGRLLRVTPAGIDKSVVLPTSHYNLALVASPDRILVAWIVLTPTVEIRVDYALFDHEGNPIGEGSVGDGYRSGVYFVSEPIPGWDGTQFLVAWRTADDGAQSESMRAARIRPDGTPADAAPQMFGATARDLAFARHGATTMIAATHGGRYSNESDLFAYPVASFPATLPAEGSVVAWSASLQRRPAAAASGETALAVYSEGTSTTPAVAELMAPNRPPKRIELSTANAYAAVAANGEQFLAVWGERTPLGNGYEQLLRLRARRIGLDGTLRDAAPIELTPVQRCLACDPPSVASDGSGFYVAWQAGTNPYALHGTLVRADGTSGFALRQLTAPSTNLPKQSVRVVWTGTVYAVLWKEQPVRANGEFDVSLRMVRVSADGVQLDREPVVLATEVVPDLPSERIDAKPDGNGRILLTWLTLDCVRALLLGRDGLPVGAAQSVVCGQTFDPWSKVAAASTGRGYALFWVSGPWGRGKELRYVTVDARLDTLHEPRTLVRPGMAVYELAATSTNDSVLLVYDKATDEGGAGGARRVFGRVLPKSRF